MMLCVTALHEPQNILKKQEVRPKNLTSVQIGWGTWNRTKIYGVRVRCSTFKLFPIKRYLIYTLFLKKVKGYFIHNRLHLLKKKKPKALTYFHFFYEKQKYLSVC